MAILSGFVHEAMSQAKYRILDDGSIFGEIPACQGVWANESSLEKCREVLQEVLEEWLVLKLGDHDPLPRLGNIDSNRMVAKG